MQAYRRSCDVAGPSAQRCYVIHTRSVLNCLPAHNAAQRMLQRSKRLLCRALERDSLHTGQKVDLVLSSGFLAFANHSGFLQAVEESGLKVAGVMGTSAGALAGSLYCAGYSPREVASALSRDAPVKLLRPSLTPWKGGIISLDGVVERLRELLPATFEELQQEFAVGVVTSDGRHILIDSGPLPEAVAASAAIPIIFQGVDIPGQDGNPCKDGGVVDRIGLKAWRDRRRAQFASAVGPDGSIPPALVHVISRSSPFSGFDDADGTGERDILVLNSPKSGVNFFSLGDFDEHMQMSVARARPLVQAALGTTPRDPRSSPERRRVVSTA